MTLQQLECGRHGKGPGYFVCMHIMDGAKAAFIKNATESEFGEAVCYMCEHEAKHRDLTPDECSLICAGCFAETQGIKL